MQLTSDDFKEIEARRDAIIAEHRRANRQRIVDASRVLADRLPPGMGTTREEMEVRCHLAQVVGCLQGLAASGDLTDDGVRAVCEVMGRCG